MPVDSNIALGVRVPEIASPVAQYAQLMQLQGLQRQNKLADFQMQNTMEDRQRANALRQSLAGAGTDPARIRNAFVAAGDIAGLNAFNKNLTETRKAETDIGKTELEIAAKTLDLYRGQLGNVTDPDTAARWVMGQYSDPRLAPILGRTGTAEQALARIPRDPQGFQAWLAQNALGMDKFIEKNAPQLNTQNLGGTVQDRLYRPLTGAIEQVGSPQQKTPEIPQGFVRGADGTLTIEPGYLQGKSQIAAAGRPVTTIKMPEQEKEFEKELGKKQAAGLIESKAKADDAAEIINTVNIGKQILNSGMVTGFGAEALVGIGQALKQAGIDFGGDATANSQAYAANMAQNVGKIIKLFGAGTGLSNADREYAEKMAGGKITLDEKAMRKILEINERGALNVITGHNKKAAGIKTNIPLTVEVPKTEAKAPSTSKLSPAEQTELDALRKRFAK